MVQNVNHIQFSNRAAHLKFHTIGKLVEMCDMGNWWVARANRGGIENHQNGKFQFTIDFCVGIKNSEWSHDRWKQKRDSEENCVN